MTPQMGTMRLHRLLVTAAAGLALVAGLAVPASAGSASRPGAGPVVAKVAAKKTAATQVQRVRVNWKGNWKNRDYVNTATIPGIGSLDLVCKPNDTKIRLYSSERGRETQMWLQKYEVKGGKDVVSVKTPRIYRWSHADDNGKGGTGFYTHEGLNQVGSIENRSEGSYMYGVISAQASRSPDGPRLPDPLPVTTFELTWNWNGFNHPLKYRSCTIDATFTTQFPEDQRAVLTWRGWQTNPQTESQTLIPGIGWLHLSCPAAPTDDSQPVPPTIWIDPYNTDDIGSSSLYVEKVQGEGQVAYQRDTFTVDYDAEEDRIPPTVLPTNGTMRMQVTLGSTKRWIMLSSYWVANDRWGPDRNVCEIAAGVYDR